MVRWLLILSLSLTLLTSAPLDVRAVQTPADSAVESALGSLTISTYSPVTITGIEYSTNIYFIISNPTPENVVISVPDPQTMAPDLPTWIFHFFAFQDTEVLVPAGGSTQVEYIFTNEGQGQALISFPFSIPATGEQLNISLDIISSASPNFSDLPRSAVLTGTVRSVDGNPIPGAEVKFYLFNGRASWSAVTDEAGLYSLQTPTLSDLQTALGGRRMPYHTLAYFVTAEAVGYRFGYQGEIYPTAGQTAIVDFSLETAQAESFSQMGLIASDGIHGYWWLKADTGFNNFYGVQARHPTALEQPGHIIGLTAEGGFLFQVTTDDECWGFDRSVDGNLAAGCHSGKVYLLDGNGNLLWALDAQSMNREIRFSPDGAKIFTGPFQQHRTALLDLNGQVLWGLSPYDQWLRSSRFSPDGLRIAAGFSGGPLSMLDSSGVELWRTYLGEFPLMMALDADYNLYAGGKNREIFAYDGNGALRWRRRVGNHVISAGADNLSADGSLLVFGTVGGFLIAYDASGQIRWQRPISPSVNLQGHNACYITPDGSRIVVGGNDGSVFVFDAFGTRLWTWTSPDVRDPSGYDHNQTGAICIIMADDGSRLAAGYGDSVIRIFQKNAAQAGGPVEGPVN